LDTFSGELAFIGPAIAVLVILAVPPILSKTYAGIAAVDPAIRDAARGMGMTSNGVLMKVELPVALPLIISGLRSAFLQVVATATIAAVVSLGGFGRFVLDGQKPQNYSMMVAGAGLGAILGISVDRVCMVRDPAHRRRPDPGADRALRGVARTDRPRCSCSGHDRRHARP